MNDIQYNKRSLNNCALALYEIAEVNEHDYPLLALGEQLIDNIKRIDQWLSGVDGCNGNKFDVNNHTHVRLYAKLALLDIAIENIVEKAGIEPQPIACRD